MPLLNYLIATMEPKSNETPCIWARKTAATASYKAVPSIFMAAPTGRTNLEIRGSTPPLSSKQDTVAGRAAMLFINAKFSK